MKKFLMITAAILVGIYLFICLILYFFQEKLIFHPEKLDAAYPFEFDQKFEEKNIQTSDGTILHGLLFKADRAKGLIFYLHGNAGSVASWGSVAETYTNLHYDVFILDYRGYGKSQGKITSQAQLYDDIQVAYDDLKKYYPENSIVVLGYSIGTGPAAYLASTNRPGLLILQAPYYSLTDMMRHTFSFIPTFILNYPFETNRYLKACKMPITLFHGTQDEVIYYGSSLKLREELKDKVRLLTLAGEGHNGMTDNPEYKTELEKILANR